MVCCALRQELYKLGIHERALVVENCIAVPSKHRAKLRRVGKESINDRV
jgi:hypothetical protein